MGCQINSREYQYETYKQGSKRILQLLKTDRSIVNVYEDIECDEKYGNLTCIRYINQKLVRENIKVISDRQHKTGNYFAETIANNETNKLGKFLSTESDWIFYYFIDKNELHIFKTSDMRPWFIENQNNFKERDVNTLSLDTNEILYSSKGKLLPIKEIKKLVPVWIYDVNIREYTHIPSRKAPN